MKRLLSFVLFIFSFSSVVAQNADTAEVSITNFKLYSGTFSWRPDAVDNVGNFFDMTAWNSSPYTQGHLKQGSSFRMNYRLLYPLAHNVSYQPGYPLIVMLHGAGEKANCWGGVCYYGTTSYSPNTSPTGATEAQLNNLLNNDHNLVHGGEPHLNARNLAAGKLPDDPTLNPRAFPGFVLFPQMLNGWDGQYEHAIRIIRLLVKQLNIDPNRIYIHGLSNGGHGVLNALRTAPWLFAASAPMSAVPSHSSFRSKALNDSLTHIPLWFFQGGQDGNPIPSYTEETVRRLRASGLSVRYTLYPSLGHGVWNNAYAEPDFFSWLLSHNKSDITVYYGNPTICGTTGEGAKLGLALGFPAYQWERDGVIIPGATSYQYTATIPGIYRARFSRVINPTASQWNIWSKPVTVTEVMPGQASIEVIGSTHLRGPDNLTDSLHNTVTLRSISTDDNYYWYRNGVLLDHPHSLQDDTLRHYTIMDPSSAPSGVYTLRTAGFDNCPTLDSDPAYLFFNNTGAPISTSLAPSNFIGTALSSSSILLRWTDRSTVERGFEIYRRKLGQPPFVFVKRAPEDAVQFIDTNLEPNTTYEYKIRLVNNQGKSNYIPSIDLNVNLVVATLSDNVTPGAPQNLTATASGNRKITLTWTPPADQDVDHYFIYFGSDSLEVQAPLSTYTFTGLALNSTFNYTMRAVDQSGKFSQASNQSTANTYVTGLFYKHSTGAWSDLDDPTLQATFVNPEFTGVVPNFTLTPRTQEDFFNFEFEGYISIAAAGSYRFRLNSDDGARVYIDNVLAVDNDGLHGSGPTATGNSINLTSGPHEIRVIFFENGGGQDLFVRWAGPDTGGTNNFQLIPANKLQSGTTPPAPLPPIAPINLVATPASMTGINLDWDYTGENPNGLKIIVLGSSTAAGVVGPSSLSKSWVERLRTTLTANTTNLTLTNLGFGGLDTYDVMPTGSTPAPDGNRNITYALAQNPNIIIVNLPTNDVANSIPLATTMANFRAIKNLADARGIQMFITTSQPRNNLSQPNRDLLDTTADSIRAAFGSYVIDIYDELTDFDNNRTIKAIYHSGDNIHLNDSGHYYIYEQTRSKLMAYLNTFELQRSLADAGPYTTIARTTNTDFSDAGLMSNTEYFYRVRTVNLNGSSPYSAVASTATFTDNIPPSQPIALSAPSKTMTSISLIWTASTDNVAVAGYEIWANGVLMGTSAYPAYMLGNLNPGTPYGVYVRAYDGQGNFSIASATLLSSATTTNGLAPYFSKSTGLLTDLATWGLNADGSGTAPASFVANGNIFNVSNRPATGLGGNLTVEGTTSKIVVTSGVTLNVDNALNARVEVQGTGAVNLNYADQTPQLLTLSSASTVNYNYVDDVVFVQQKSYGNLGLSGEGPKTFQSGITTVAGNLTVGTGVGLKGVFGNLTTINLMGDLTYTGTPGYTASENTVTLNMIGNGVQSITTPDILDLFQMNIGATTTVNVVNNGSANTLRFGSPNGGGLQLVNGSEFNLGENNLELVGNAVINGNNETGIIGIDEGQIKITSSASQSSNLYFDATDQTLARLEGNLTGTGEINIQSPVNISDGLKISAGTINSGGNVTLLSTLDKTANLEEIENSGEITGDVTVHRYIHAKGRIYRYISSSVEGVTIADWQTYIPITGTFTGASTGAGLGTTPSLFYYGTNVWVPYPTIDNTAPIERGRGYSVFIRNTSSQTLLQTNGVPYQGEIPFQINPAIPDDETSGWNLLGNPYASTVAWSLDNSQWPRSGVSNVITVRQNNADTLGINQYRYYDALTGAGNLSGGRLAPGQAFWIKSTTINPTLAIRESAKRATQHFLFREGSSTFSKMTITLSQGIKSDPAFIVLTPEGTDLLDQEFDGIKRSNEGLFNFSTLPENSTIALAINNGSDSFCSKSIRLNLQNVTPGNYTIAASDLESFTGVGSVVLVDNVLNTATDLKSSTYNFSITSDPLTFGVNRFTLELNRPDLDLSIESSAEDICTTPARVTLHKTQSAAHYVLLNERNVPVTEEIIGNGEDIEFEIKKEFLVSGANRFRVRSSFLGCTSGHLTKDVEINYANPLLPEVATATACPGTSAFLAVTNQVPYATYKWFTPSGTKIKNVSGPSLTTGAITEYSEYEVAMIINGCEGPRQLVQIKVPILPVPEVHISGRQLVTTATSGIQWLKDGVPMFNETGTSLRPRSTGNYSVTISNNGCTILSEPVLWKVNSEFAVYPNPGKPDNLNVLFRSSQEGSVRIVITDLLGKVHFDNLFDSEVLFDGMRLDLKYTLNPGVYFVQMNQNGTIRKVRFVLE